MNDAPSATELNETKEEGTFLTRPLLIIFLTIFIDLVGFGIVIPLLPFYAEEMHATPFDIGLLVSSYSLMQFISSPVWGNLSDRFGRRPILFWTIIGSSIGYWILGFANVLWMLYAGRILAGIMGGNLSTAQAYIADVTTRENRAKGMGLFGMAFGFGFIIGPALAGILSRFGHHVPFLVAASMSLCNAILLYFILPESRKAGDRSVSSKRRNRFADLAEALGNKRFGLITVEYFLVIASFAIMTTAFAYYMMVKFGYNAEKTGYLLAYVGFISAIIQGGIFGRLANRVGEASLVAFGSLVLVLSLFAVPFVGADAGGLITLLIGMAGFSLGNSLASPALTSLASKTVGEEEQGKSFGIMQSAASLGRVLGPLLCGALLNNAVNEVDNHTIFRTFWTASGIMFVAFVIAAYYLRSFRVREEQRVMG
jgi:DHA1 family tetracycline resistance protein-like MFS transporter